MKEVKKGAKKTHRRMLVPIFAGILGVAVLSAGATLVVMNEFVTRGFRQFTIEGRYAMSEIRVNVDVAGHPTIDAQGDLLTLGFDPNRPIGQDSEFLARYTDKMTGEVVETKEQDMGNFAAVADLPDLLENAEIYRRWHTGLTMVFDRFGNISVEDVDGKAMYSGGYLWIEHRLAVVVRHNLPIAGGDFSYRNYLFFPNNEEIMQGTRCKRIIVRERAESREQGSIELLFGVRCPGSPAPQ